MIQCLLLLALAAMYPKGKRIYIYIYIIVLSIYMLNFYWKWLARAKTVGDYLCPMIFDGCLYFFTSTWPYPQVRIINLSLSNTNIGRDNSAEHTLQSSNIGATWWLFRVTFNLPLSALSKLCTCKILVQKWNTSLYKG